MRRYARLFAAQVRTSMILALQYRSDFLVNGGISIFFTATALTPLFVVYGARPSIAGWSFGEALVVTGFFTLLGGVLEGAIQPSLAAVVEHIRKGTLDLVLLKPADAQFLVSTQRFLPWQVTSLVAALAIFAYGFHRLGRAPSLAQVGTALVFLVAAIAVLYSLWILVVSAAFYVVKIDNLSYLFSSIFDAARWPATIFRGVLSWVFTFVIPLALLTTYPAEALLGRLRPMTFVGTLAGAAAFVVVGRLVWLRSLARYTSAGG